MGTINGTSILSLNDFVDIYKIGDDILEVYYIPTRARLDVQVSSPVFSFVQGIDGVRTIETICEQVGITSVQPVLLFCEFLIEKKIAKLHKPDKLTLLSAEEEKRFSRQLDFFDAKFNSSADYIQHKIKHTKFVIFGTGAIGSGIAVQLAMAGAENFVLIDKDVLSRDSIERHYFYDTKDIGRFKVSALADFLHKINSRVHVVIYHETVDYHTNLEKYLDDATFVVNTLDEPYIGVTSLKIGRECYKKKIPLYVAGGFDAHLMSTGELIIPDITPCVDCYVAYFTEKLKNWKPNYNTNAISSEHKNNNFYEVGGLASQSLFSISYAVIVILDYIGSGSTSSCKGRGEMMLDAMNINYIRIDKNPLCHVCSSK